MAGIKCSRCNKITKQNLIHLHHIFPKYLGGTDKNTKRIYLCKKCHDNIHECISTLNMSEQEEINKFTQDWLHINKKASYPYCPQCKNKERKLALREIHFDYVVLGCAYCGYLQECQGYYFSLTLQKQIQEDLKLIKKEEKKNGGSISKV